LESIPSVHLFSAIINSYPLVELLNRKEDSNNNSHKCTHLANFLVDIIFSIWSSPIPWLFFVKIFKILDPFFTSIYRFASVAKSKSEPIYPLIFLLQSINFSKSKISASFSLHRLFCSRSSDLYSHVRNAIQCNQQFSLFIFIFDIFFIYNFKWFVNMKRL